MRFHGIDMVGKYYMESKDKDVESFEERRLIYDPNDEEVYFGSGSAWVVLKSGTSTDIPTGTVMWFYQASAPTGWTIVAAAAEDRVVAVRSSSGEYNVAGGSLGGDWSGLDHTHADNFSVPNHNHLYYRHDGGDNKSYTYQANGVDEIAPSSNHSEDGGYVSQATSDEAFDENGYTANESISISGSVTATTTLDDARPRANVGILATKD